MEVRAGGSPRRGAIVRIFQASYLALGALLALLAGAATADWALSPINAALTRSFAISEKQTNQISAPTNPSSDRLPSLAIPGDFPASLATTAPVASESSKADVRPVAPVETESIADGATRSDATDPPATEIDGTAYGEGHATSDAPAAAEQSRPAAPPDAPYEGISSSTRGPYSGAKRLAIRALQEPDHS